MLTIPDWASVARRNEVTRRNFLRVGALTLGGLCLGDVLRLRAEAPAPGRTRQKSIIMIHLSGGPSHIDMYDMKPDAPREYRGEFTPIKTNVPGMEICELMPQQARIADKFTILRGVQLSHLHTANEFYSGSPWQDDTPAAGLTEARRPPLGAVVSRVRGAQSTVPPYVSLMNPADWERAYYLGLEYEPFRVGGGNSQAALNNMRRPADVSVQRLGNRQSLLRAFDNLQRDVDQSGKMTGLDGFQARALQMVTSGKVREAFDLDREADKTRARYGDRPAHSLAHPGRALLQARRLVEAGVSVVTYSYNGWDTHSHNFAGLRRLIPPLDRALSALVLDLDQRGLLDDVLVLMGGEFGRTPRLGDVTPDGRGHWSPGFLWIGGGGLKTGQILGATDARAERIAGNPIRMQNVLATVYQVLGIDPSRTFSDYNGRPQYVLENRDPVPGLL